jgi:hypothetical protein
MPSPDARMKGDADIHPGFAGIHKLQLWTIKIDPSHKKYSFK